MTAVAARTWTPVFPRQSPWSTITYSKVPKLGITSLRPANGSNHKLVVIRAHQGTNLMRIPPGHASWETRVRIIGPDADLSQGTTTSFTNPFLESGSAVNHGMPNRAFVKIQGDASSKSYSDADTRSVPVHGARPLPVYTIRGKDVDTMVIRTDESAKFVPTNLHTFSVRDSNVTLKIIKSVPNQFAGPNVAGPPRKITIRPTKPDDPAKTIEYATSIPMSRIVIRDKPTQIISPRTIAAAGLPSDTTYAWLPITQCAVRTLPDLLKDLALLCTIKRRNVSDIQLHVTCHRFRVIRQLYDNLNKISDLRLSLSTHTLTRPSRRRSSIRPDKGQYEVCVRSDNNTSLLEAARTCKEAAERATAECSFRISTNTHTYN